MRRKWFQKVMAAGLALTMAASLAACGGTGEQTQESEQTKEAVQGEEAASQEESASAAESGPDVKTADAPDNSETIEISVAIWNAGQNLGGDAVQTAIEEKLNIKIVPVNVTWDDYTQKSQLWAASGSLPDIFTEQFRSSSTYPQFASQGLIKAIPENLDAYPNLKTYLEGEAAKNAMLNGQLYCIPRQTYPSQEWTAMDRTIIYRWDLAQKAGIEKEPENWEEFQEMMRAIIAADPDGTGIGGMTADGKYTLGGTLMPYVSPFVCGNGLTFKWVEGEDGQYLPAYFAQDTTAGLQMARNMYAEGLIDKDVALLSGNTGVDKFLQGKSAAIAVCGGFGASYNSMGRYWTEVHGTDYMDDVRALDVMPGMDGTLSYAVWDYAWSESYINANVDDAKLDRILQLYDYLLSDEGMFLSLYGPEGELYDMVDGKVVLKNPEIPILDTYPSTDSLGILARWNPSTYDDRCVATVPDEYVAVDKERVAQAAQMEIPAYNQRCTELVMELGIDFNLHLDDDFLAVITGKAPVEEMWKEICDGYEQAGLSDMVKQVNEALAAK